MDKNDFNAKGGILISGILLGATIIGIVFNFVFQGESFIPEFLDEDNIYGLDSLRMYFVFFIIALLIYGYIRITKK